MPRRRDGGGNGILSLVRALLFFALLSSPQAAAAAPEPSPAQYREDFGVFCSEVEANYAYFDSKATRWADVPRLYEPDLARVRTREDFVRLLEQAVAELYDDHAHLNTNTATSPRLVPSGTDLWAEWAAGAATITDVRRGSDADRAGLRPGAIVISMNGTAIAEAVTREMPRSVPQTDEGARNWALRRVLAGRHGETRRIQVDQAEERRNFELPAARTMIVDASTPLTFRRLEGDVGYIRFHDSLGDSATVAELDRALAALEDTRALVLDLRETPSGGNSTVARGILGRFVSHESAYQKHELVAEERATGIRRSWTESVTPRGPFVYMGKVAILVGRWTGSMGEGLAIGFDGVGRGTIVGRPMAGLLGATSRIDLPHSKIGVNLPVERLFHVNGTPREQFRPTVAVTQGSDPETDETLQAGARAAAGLTPLPDPLRAGWNGSPVCEKLHEDPGHRVLRCSFPPSVGHERHFHAPHFGFAVSGGRMRISDAGGTREVELATGSSFTSTGVDWHEVVNVGDTTVVYLIVEPK